LISKQKRFGTLSIFSGRRSILHGKVHKIYISLLLGILFSINYAGAQTPGCSDPLAINYSSTATGNDGSCIYSSASVSPVLSFDLASDLSETSGILIWNNRIWTHNDNADTNLYSLDTLNGNIIQSYKLTGSINNEWEEISQDENYVFIGDFGNNLNGNRIDLRILKISKNSILADSPVIETINFSYSNQYDFTPTGANNTDFDCEAFIVSSDSIFLFTKQWVSNKTSVYSLPKSPGNFTARLRSTYDVQGLITGAVYLEAKKLIALCGYSSTLEPYAYLLYDFSSSGFFSGNKRKISISLPYHQTEGITTADGLKYYITNENFSLPPLIEISQKLHIFDFNSFLGNYFESLIVTIPGTGSENNILIYPVPADNFFSVKRDSDAFPEKFSLMTFSGQVVIAGTLSEAEQEVDIRELAKGIYLLKVGTENPKYLKIIKK
jgi:hypothetical protein